MFVLWGFCAFCKSVGLFERCEHWISPSSFFESLQHLFSPLCCSYIVVIFLLFSIILYYFLHTYTSKPVHMLFFFVVVFFKLPHSFDVLARFINFIWEYKSRSPGERSFMNCFSPTWFYWFHSVLFFLETSDFQPCLLWELRF